MIQRCDPVVLTQIKALVAPILQSSDSLQTRQRRLARLGYTIARFDGGAYLATVPHGVRLIELW